MSYVYTVAFFGHRYIDHPYEMEKLLEKEIGRLIDENGYVNFLVGRNGEFDQCVASSVLRVQKNEKDGNSSLVLMLPYPTAEYLNNRQYFENYYGDIEILHPTTPIHPKALIQARNREMVDRADLIICFVTRKQGGAYQTVQYALKQNKTVINLFSGNV